MTRRRILRSLATLLAAGLCATTVSVTAAGSADAQSSDASPTAFEQLAACAQESKTLLVLLLMDESGSLRETDPDALRISAAQTALRQLARLEDQGVDTQVQLAGFGARFTTYGGWTGATPDNLSALEDQVTAFRQRMNQVDTDFHVALVGARDALASRATQTAGETSPCRLLLLFTDGNYDIEPRTTPERRERYGETKEYAPNVPLTDRANAGKVVELGRALVCDEDGLADELRDGDVVTAAVALDQNISEGHRRFLRGVAGAPGCGSESDSRFGAYVSASDTSELIAGFDRIGNEVGGAKRDEGDTNDRCPRSADCTEGGFAFALDGTVAGFHLLLQHDSPDVVAHLTAPNGEQVTIPADPQPKDLAGAQLDVTTLSPVDVAVDATLPAHDGGWTGTWRVAFVDPSGRPGVSPRGHVYLFGALSPHYAGDREVRRGDTAQIVAQIAGRNGEPVTSGALDAQMSAEIIDPASGAAQVIELSGPDDDGHYRGRYTPPEDATAAAVTLDLTLTSTTPSGLMLQPRSLAVPIEVLPPASHPRIEPAALRLSSLSAESAANGTLTVRGGEHSGGCVWITSLSTIDRPRLSGELTASYEPPAAQRNDCVHVAAGETEEINVEIDADVIATGTGEATLHLRAVSDDDVAEIDTTVPVTFEMINVIDQAERAFLVLAILIPGIAMPILLLWLLNWAGARYEPMVGLKHARIPVRVGSGEQIERIDGSALSLHHSDFVNCGEPATPARAIELEELSLRSKTPLWPFRMPFGVASANGSPPKATGSEGMVRRGDSMAARVRFALARQWVFVLTEAVIGDDGKRPTAVGVLHVFLPDGPIAAQAPDVEAAIARDLPERALAIAEQEIARTAEIGGPGDDGRAPPHEPEARDDVWHPPSGAPGGRSNAPEPVFQPDVTRRPPGEAAGTSEGWRPPPRR